jgi:uncharacterized protein (TIGR02466 family)
MSDSGLFWQVGVARRDRPARAFLPLLRSAIEAHPERLDLLRDLANSLRDDGRPSEAVALLAPLDQAGRLTPDLALQLGAAAAAGSEPESALPALEAAAAKGVPQAHRELAFLFHRLGRYADVVAPARAALRHDPCDDGALEKAAQAFIHEGDVDGLTALCRDLDSQGVGTATLLAFRAVASALASRHDELAMLVDRAQWCAQSGLGPECIDNDQLADEILSHPALIPSAGYTAARGGNLRLDELERRHTPAIRNLLDRIRREVDSYVAQRCHSTHPLMTRRPATVRLQGWALVLKDDGHEELHIHPNSWLNAVYYVRTPKSLSDGPLPPGAILFGPWPPDVDQRVTDFPRWHIEPQAGMLLIFPASFGHGTIPTRSTESRISIALNVNPVLGIKQFGGS